MLFIKDGYGPRYTSMNYANCCCMVYTVQQQTQTPFQCLCLILLLLFCLPKNLCRDNEILFECKVSFVLICLSEKCHFSVKMFRGRVAFEKNDPN